MTPEGRLRTVIHWTTSTSQRFLGLLSSCQILASVHPIFAQLWMKVQHHVAAVQLKLFVGTLLQRPNMLLIGMRTLINQPGT